MEGLPGLWYEPESRALDSFSAADSGGVHNCGELDPFAAQPRPQFFGIQPRRDARGGQAKEHPVPMDPPQPQPVEQRKETHGPNLAPWSRGASGDPSASDASLQSSIPGQTRSSKLGGIRERAEDIRHTATGTDVSLTKQRDRRSNLAAYPQDGRHEGFLGAALLGGGPRGTAILGSEEHRRFPVSPTDDRRTGQEHPQQSDGGGGETYQAFPAAEHGPSWAASRRTLPCVSDSGSRGGPPVHERPLIDPELAHVSGRRPPLCPAPRDPTAFRPAPGQNNNRQNNNSRHTADHVNRILAGTYRTANGSSRPLLQTEWEAPAHLKSFGRTDWQLLDLLICEAWSHDNRKMALWYWLKTAVTEPHLLTAIPPPQFVEEAELTAIDIQRMLDLSYIEAFNGDLANIKSTVKVFSVMEKEGTRRRIIFHPQLINLFLADAGFLENLVELPSVDDQVAVCSNFPGGLCVDGTAFYTQFPVQPNVDANFVFAHLGTLYRNRSICTGQRQCVALAQLALCALIEITRRTHPEVHYTPYVDNVRFCGPNDNAKAAWKSFRMRAEEAHLEFEIQSEWATEYTFLGIHYQHTVPAISLGEKALKKLAAWQLRISGPGADWTSWTLQEAVGLFGILVWAGRVLDINAGPYYYFLKFLRRRGQCELSEDAHLWPCLHKILQHWLAAVTSKHRLMGVSIRSAETVYVYSDASLKGRGAVIYFRNSIFISAGIFSRDEKIHILEARAWLASVEFVLKALGTEISSRVHVCFFIDNTSVIGAQARGYTKNYLLNTIVLRLRDRMTKLFGSFEVHYIKSALNHADYSSRVAQSYEVHFPFSPEESNFIEQISSFFDL